MTNVVIVGGGTAGWMTAGWLSKKNKGVNVTVIESPNIPKIGVGESVTPHVASFFVEMGVPTNDWMFNTGAIYKFANKFSGWKKDPNHYEYFGFNYTTNSNFFHKDISQAVTRGDWLLANDCANKSTDVILELFKNKDIEKFDKYFNSPYHYMQNNTSPFINDYYLLNPVYSWSQHINADLAGDYIRDKIAKSNGVQHIQQNVAEVIVNGNNIKELVLEDGRVITADLFVDCTGFRKLLANKLGRKVKLYKDNPVNRAWVCQIDYENPNEQMVNYTQSIAKDAGWMFKIGLYHRMGSGYCFSSDYTTDEQALEQFNNMIDLKRKDPRLLTWTPSRLEKLADGNTVCIGLSGGFVEPMEANALFIIINGIGQLSSVLREYETTNHFDYTSFNEKMAYSLDDIADFIKVHYTLSDHDHNDFWNDMRALHHKEDHHDLLYSKYTNPNNVMTKAVDGYSLFPDYMWAQLATSWGVDTSKWYSTPDTLTVELARMHFRHQEQKHKLVSNSSMNNYDWLRKEVFKGMTSNEWDRQYVGK